jgi:dTDP-4-amino-4,6-dideoxygalactose transaminase
MEVADKHNLRLVEDAAQAHLAEFKGKKCGTFGDLGCFSFQSSKVMPCGEGGAIVGDDAELFLGNKRLMDEIADAMIKIHDNRDQLVKL